MLLGRNILKLFEIRGRAVTLPELRGGMRVGRGFADVGHEEFMVLQGGRILSLLTGEVSSLDSMRREHLFEILSTDALIAEIHQAGYRFLSLACPEQRHWEGEIESSEQGERYSSRCTSLEECLLQLALAARKIEIVPEVRCLKSVKVNA